MSVAAHQELEKNEEPKTGKRKAGEERRQATDFNETVCCPFVVVQGAARPKNDLSEGNAGLPGPSRRSQPFQPNLNGVGDRTTWLRRLFDWCRGIVVVDCACSHFLLFRCYFVFHRSFSLILHFLWHRRVLLHSACQIALWWKVYDSSSLLPSEGTACLPHRDQIFR